MKKTDNNKRETWTIQPAQDVRRAMEKELRNLAKSGKAIAHARGERSRIINEALRNYLLASIAEVLKEDIRSRESALKTVEAQDAKRRRGRYAVVPLDDL